MCYCFCFVLFFVFLRDLFCRKPLRCSTLDNSMSTETGGQPRQREGGQFVKHKNNFLRLRNHRRRAAELKRCWLFREEISFPHMASDLSLCIFLFLTGCQSRRLVFLSCPSPWHTPAFLYLLAAALEGSEDFFSLIFFLFSALPLQPLTYQHCAHEPEWPADGADEENMRWSKERRREGRTVSTLPVEQKPLYFLPWNKSAFRLQTESRAWVLIDIEHTLFMFPLMGYFLHVSLAPQVLMGRRVQREDGSCATPGFNLRQSACLACECACARVHAPNSEPASACGSV